MAYTPELVDWKSKAGGDVYHLPEDLFDALQIRNKKGKLLTAAQARPRGGLVGREFNDMMSMASMQAHMLPPSIAAQYGITPTSASFVGPDADFYQQQALNNPVAPMAGLAGYAQQLGQQGGGQAPQGLSGYAPTPYYPNPYYPGTSFGSTFGYMGSNPYMGGGNPYA